jgi:glycine/D-amino acid oxidase-like deaminating enzyme
MNFITTAAKYPVWHDAGVIAWEPKVAPASANVDVAIIGGGLSGLWTAYYLTQLRPEARVAVLEARRVGFGASGRNGGWCSGFFPLLPTELADVFGGDKALEAYRESFRTLDEIERVLRQEGIRCDWHRGGTVQSASTSLQAERLNSMVSLQHALGLGSDDMEWLSPQRVADQIRVAETHGAVYSPHCATVNPFLLTVGLADVVRKRGVSIWEHTTVKAIDGGTVEHQYGHLCANLVVQATEGYSHVLRRTRRRLVPLYSLMVATEPLDVDVVNQLGWKKRATFNDGGNMIIYAQLTADNRIAFGGRGAPYHFGSRVRDRFDLDDNTHLNIAASIARHFPAAAHAKITHRWGGPLGLPRDWIPSVELDRRERFARLGGYAGDGVAATNLFARMLVDAWHETRTPVSQLPFINHRSPKWEIEPFRFVGVNSLIRLSNSLDKHEETHGVSPPVRRRIFDSLL